MVPALSGTAVASTGPSVPFQRSTTPTAGVATQNAVPVTVTWEPAAPVAGVRRNVAAPSHANAPETASTAPASPVDPRTIIRRRRLIPSLSDRSAGELTGFRAAQPGRPAPTRST